MPTFLHVGCGQNRKGSATPGFAADAWSEIRLDIDPDARPDVLCSMTDMAPVADGSVDAVFSSHNLEHLYAHEVPAALAEFARVLKPEGFCVIACPDLQSVAALVAEDRLTEPAYQSPAGPVAALDMLYGHRASVAAGKLHMAHKCGFTERTLTDSLLEAGFATAASIRRGPPAFELWALAAKSPADEARMRSLAAVHFPGGSDLAGG
jgi:SAM-dependent methyltransferase